MTYVKIGGLRVDSVLADFVDSELLTRLPLTPDAFWTKAEALLKQFTPRNAALLARRQSLQEQIDAWHREHPGRPKQSEYLSFLSRIGYLNEPAEDFVIETSHVDQEISLQAGPQLVVPVKNARFALNAANARWGSLYDALYGTDAIDEADGAQRGGAYNPIRGAKVIAYARAVLDQACPLHSVSHAESDAYFIEQGELRVRSSDGVTALRDPSQFRGYTGPAEAPHGILLCNNNLHLEIQIDPESEIGREDSAGIKDIVLEAAVTTIQDCEDSVAAVDAEDKVEVYRNCLGLITGELEETFQKDGVQVTRRLSANRSYQAPDGSRFELPGRSLLLFRNVGHLMRNPAILDKNGSEVYEGLLDAVITGAIGAVDILGKGPLQNSRAGSVYIVKPKMHGPEEVRFACDVFAAVEMMLGLELGRMKLGIMDEERRTTVSLKACIKEAKDRVVFINTGFLDRTGDEIHTAMEAGPMVPKADMKACAWIAAYEQHNVQIGLSCGFQGRSQIGKGRWAMPDLMAAMLEQKQAHPEAGANTAWVPSPTAAVLHALHYHRVDVREVQAALKNQRAADRADILTVPLLSDPSLLTSEQIQRELDNNAQSILGYVVRWVDQGIGCSKVPDINNVGLMEDRATLRISSQHIANWLRHGMCTELQVKETLLRMAAVVDEQNRHDPLYEAMAQDPDQSISFQAACDLVFKGCEQPNGYTEPVLHRARLAKKAQNLKS
ncbi:MAG: malate synthase G [Pseudomonadota bacterium]|nr:malate synthase G [Pseudomonadota bacterium]